MNPRPRQVYSDQTILSFIRHNVKKRGFAPTVREIGEFLGGASTSVVNYRLVRLARRGDIVMEPKKARGIRVVKGVDTHRFHVVERQYGGQPDRYLNAGDLPCSRDRADALLHERALELQSQNCILMWVGDAATGYDGFTVFGTPDETLIGLFVMITPV